MGITLVGTIIMTPSGSGDQLAVFQDVGGALVVVGADHFAFEAQFLDQRQRFRLGADEAIRVRVRECSRPRCGFR